MEAPPSPHSLAVSGLMQQLKSGEISKMQLFQEIAKLQAKAASLNNPPEPAPVSAAPPISFTLSATTQAAPAQGLGNVFTPGTSGSFGARIGTSQQLFQTSFIGSTPAVPVLKQPPAAVPPVVSALKATSEPGNYTGRAAGATPIVESDAEFLASGVSHDKAQRFSVQEWMASKQRGSSVVSQPSNATGATGLASLFSQAHQFSLQQQQQQPQLFADHPPASTASVTPNLFTFSQHHLLSSDEQNNPISSIRVLSSQNADAYTNANQDKEVGKYEYNPQRVLHHIQPALPNGQDAENCHDPLNSNEQEFIDFTEHFREDLDGEGLTRGDDEGGHAINLTGKAPKIAGSSNNMPSGGDDAFHARVTRWKSQKDAIREQMKQQLLQSELDECTFAPKVNPKSTKVAAKLRTRQGSTKEYTSSPLAVSERLYQEADNYKAREELAQRVKAEEEADLERECTFKPKINRVNALTDKVKAKYMDVQKNPSPSLAAAAMESTAKELEQCTFFPKVNPISTEMVSAQLYLQQDIYERLSRPCCMTGTDSPSKSGRLRRQRTGSLTDDDFSRDADSELASSVTSPRCSQDDCYIRSLSPRRRRSLVTSGREARSTGKVRQQERPRSADGIRTDEDKADRARHLDSFLERQQFHENARRKKIQATTQHLLPTHKPTINKKSLGMMENGRKGDFLERITKYALRREHDSVKKKSVRVSVRLVQRSIFQQFCRRLTRICACVYVICLCPPHATIARTGPKLHVQADDQPDEHEAEGPVRD